MGIEMEFWGFVCFCLYYTFTSRQSIGFLSKTYIVCLLLCLMLIDVFSGFGVLSRRHRSYPLCSTDLIHTHVQPSYLCI